MAAGWSLGANILVCAAYCIAEPEGTAKHDVPCECMSAQVRYLGEEGADTPLVAAVSMCNPFNLVGGDLMCCLLHVCLHCGVAAVDWRS